MRAAARANAPMRDRALIRRFAPPSPASGRRASPSPARGRGVGGEGASAFHVKHPSPDADRARALALVPVSPEAEARLAIYVDLLARWRKVTNLISEVELR